MGAKYTYLVQPPYGGLMHNLLTLLLKGRKNAGTVSVNRHFLITASIFFLLLNLNVTVALAQEPVKVIWPLTADAESVYSNGIANAWFKAGPGLTGFHFDSINGATSTGWNSNNLNPKAYYEYNITPERDASININEIKFEVSLSSVNMRTAVYYSKDGFNKQSTPITNSLYMGRKSSRDLILQTNITVTYPETLTIRLYGWSAPTSAVSFFTRDVEVSGSVRGPSALPIIFNVTGGGTYCAGGSGVSIGLSDSESDASYELYLNGNPTGTIQPGTGSALTFSNVTAPGTYTIRATNTEGSSWMNGTAVVNANTVPIATATPSSQTICSGTQTSIALTANVPSTFNWTVVQSGVSGASGGTGSTIAQTLTTSSSVSGTATYTITPTSGVCTGSPIQAVVTVNPVPDVIAPLTQAICSGETTNISLSSSVSGATFSWTVTQSGATGASAGTGNSITQTLNATGSTSGTVVYTIVPSAASCTGASRTTTVTVKPVPTVVATPASQNACPGKEIQAITITNTNGVTGTTYSWTRNAVAGLSGLESGTGTPISGTINSTTPATLLTTTFTISATADGCTSSTTASVTVGDNVNPTIACPVSGTQNVNTTTGCTYVHTSNSWNATANDNCELANLVYTLSGVTSGTGTSLNGVSFNQGITTVTWTATDESGNTASCSFSVNVTDDDNPVITCTSNQSVNTTTGLCAYNHTGTAWDATATDNCSVISSITYSLSGVTTGTGTSLNGVSFNMGVTTVTWTATDAAGNNASCSFTVTVTDNQPPTISCIGNQTRSANNGGCTYLVAGTEFDPLSYSDNCPGSTITNNYNGSTSLAGYAFTQGVHTVTWTITSPNTTPSVSCSFQLIVNDNQAPVFSNCPANITVYTGPGSTTCNQTATWTPPTATDNCNPTVNITSTHNPGATFPLGTTTVTYTATDGSGNSATCSFTVTVIDNTPPTFTPPANRTIALDASCNYNGLPSNTGTPTVLFDNCTTGLTATYTDQPWVPGACPNTGSFTRNWSVTDASGNTTTLPQLITVIDNTPPVFSSFPSNVNINCGNSTLPANTGTPVATDNCTGTDQITLTHNDVQSGTSCSRTITRTWRATDCSGNFAERVQIITVVDVTPPVVSSTGSTSVLCPRNIPPLSTSVIVATDNCNSVIVEFIDEIPYGLENQPGYCPYRVDRIFRVSDGCGNSVNATQRIDITGTNCGCSPCATDESFHLVDLDGQPNGSITIYNVDRKDKCCDAKKEDCASFNVRIDDDAVGVIITIDGASPSPQDWRIDCSSVTLHGNIVCIPGGRFYLFTYCKPGGNLNNFTFTSISGVVVTSEVNARVSCNTQIFIEDSTLVNPTWTSVFPLPVGAYDHYLSCTQCYSPFFTPDENAPPVIKYKICGQLQNNPCTTQLGLACDTVTIFIKDEINVQFNVDPGAYCQGNIPQITATVTPLGSNYVLNWYNAYDAGGTLMYTGYNFTPPYPGPYSLQVIDMENDVPCSTYIYNFDVAPDNNPPVVTAPPDLILECGGANNTQLIENWLLSATAIDDHTLNLIISNNYTGITEGCNASVQVTFSTKDECDNIGTATSFIRINDSQAPTWATGAGLLNATVECSNLAALTAAQALQPNATDICDNDLTITKTSGVLVPNPSCPQGGTITNTFVATDDCGNVSSTYTQVITITDSNIPTWTTIAGSLNRTVDCADLTGLAAAQAEMPVATDLCDPSVTIIKTSGAPVNGVCPILYTYTNTFIATDHCGNQSLPFVQVITVTDVTLPVLTTPAANLTVECDGAGNLTQLNTWLSNNGGAVATDNCSTITWTNNFTQLSDLCGQTGSATVTFTGRDACNNAVTTTATFTIIDTQGPVITCPANVISQVDPTNCVASSVVLGTPTVSDACSAIGEISVTNNAPASFPAGVTIVTWTATDACGNSSTCEQTVTVVDNVPPTVECPANVTVNADAGLCSANVTVPAPVVTDPCPYTMTNSYTGTSNANGVYPVGTTIVTWTITGISGNVTTCEQSVTVTDNQAPTILCPADVVATAPPPACTLQVVTIGLPTLSDNCDINDLILTWTKSGATTGSGTGNVNNTIFNVGVTTVEYTVTDAAGNFARCTFTVTVNDEVPPTIVNCPADISVNADAGACYASITIPPLNVTDPCGEIVSIINSFNGTNNASGQYPIGITTVTWTVTDASGNVTTCVHTVTVTDNQFPTITCPDNAIYEITNGGCTLVPAELGLPQINDNCPAGLVLTWEMVGATTGISPATGINYVNTQPFNVGITTVTYTLKDASGNTVSCSFTVWIKNLDAPQFNVSCPLTPVLSDASPSCSTYVTVPAPGINNPCDELYTVTNTSPYKTSDADASGTYPVGTTSFTWTITDASGHVTTCPQTVVVTDNTPPTLLCPPDAIDLITNNGCTMIPATIGLPTYSDNCGVVTLTWEMTGATTGASPLTGINTVNGQVFNVGQTFVTYTAYDAAGNHVSCNFMVWVKNLQAPQFTVTCPLAPVLADASPSCSTYVTVPAPGINNPCNELYTITNTSPYKTSDADASGTYPVGTTSFTWTITDASGNVTTCPQTVVVSDNTPPTLLCPPDAIDLITNNGCTMIPATIGFPTYNDNCGVVALTWVMTGATTGASPLTGINTVNGQTFNIGETYVTYTAYDQAGNNVSCTFKVWVKNLNAPPLTVDCPENVTAPSETTVCGATVTVPSPIITNPCDEAYTVTNDSPYADDNASGFYPVGVTTINWIITDASGNVTPCTQTVTITDLLPEISCPSSQVLDADFNQPYASGVTLGVPTYSDNCGIASLTWVSSAPTPGSGTGINTTTVFYVGVTTITYTVTDVNGNTNTCSFTITVNSKPDITCPTDITANTDPGECTATLNPGGPTLNSGVEPITWTYTITNQSGTQIGSGTCSTATLATCIGNFEFPVGINTISWTASNISGVDQCVQTVTVTDNQPLTFTTPAPVSFCVVDIFSALYNGQPEPDADIVPEATFLPLFPAGWTRPDWYIVNGSNELDLLGIADNCCPLNTITIAWRIDFSNGFPSITGTGQPSTYGEIKLWGTNNYTEVSHTMTYTLTDCHGNSTGPIVRIINIKPRPKVDKM